ncbi:MAG: TadE/TadG family type IV pilus assembly protein [Candidatus Dormibacteria bacterium]
MSRRPQRRRARGQTLVEFSLLLPLFLLVIFATIDFSGYFGARLSVENAARSGDRVAVTEPYASYSGPAIVSQVAAQAQDANLPSNVDCSWNGTTLAPTSYPPFTWSSGRGCIGIWYFEMRPAGNPWLCGQWSVASSSWSWWTVTGTTTTTKDNGCVAAGSDIVVVGVGYQFSPLTPLPALNGFNTYGETQLLEED